MATVICLGGGIEGLPILERVKALGHRLVVVDGNALAPGMALADFRVIASCYDVEATVAALRQLAIPYGAVICAAVDAPHVAAAVARRAEVSGWRMPGLTPEQAALGVDKYLQKHLLRDAGLPVPDFWQFGNQSTTVGTVVIKPVDSRGARGVVLIKPGDLLPGRKIMDAIQASPTGQIMVEQYLPGPQISTESIIQDGQVLFTAVGLRNYGRLDEFAHHIIEDGFDAPHGGEVVQGAIGLLIGRACRALGWFQTGGGTVKGDLVIHNGEMHIIELAPRLSGGFFCTHGHPLAYGVPFVDYAIRLALGEHVEAPTVEGGHFVSQRYVFPAPADVGKRVVNVPVVADLVPESPGKFLARRARLGRSRQTVRFLNCTHATYAVQVGDVIRPVSDHGARLGQAVASGSSPQQARERAELAVTAMRRGLVLE